MITTISNAGDKLDYGIDAPGLVRFFFLAGSITASALLSHRR